MIALRRQIERGLANPWLRPFLILVLALMLAFVVVHAAHDGAGTASEVGACLGLVIVLSGILTVVIRFFVSPRLVLVHSGRAPPRPPRPVGLTLRTGPALVPLRR